MVKLTSQQWKHNYRGYTERENKKLAWTPPNLQQRTIVCFAEKAECGSREPNWSKILQNCKARIVPPHEEVIDNRRAIYAGVDSKRKATVRRQACRANLAFSCPVAYPSAELMREVHQALQQTQLYRFYRIIIGAIPDRSPGIYIVYEDENVIYVGQTKFLPGRMEGHRNSQRNPDESAGFMDYMRYRQEHSGDWPARFFPYEKCASLAVQGQLTPDLVNDEEARKLLTARYFKNRGWGLDQAELALIAYFRPHFNQIVNVYPRPLQHTGYCQQQCRICLHAREK